MKLTEHFCERWEQRVGGPPPSPDELADMISRGVELQKYRKVFTSRGRPMTILAMYYIPRHDCVVKADTDENVAVTVISHRRMED